MVVALENWLGELIKQIELCIEIGEYDRINQSINISY